VRLSGLSFRVILILAWVSFHTVCASARCKTSLQGAVKHSKGLVIEAFAGAGKLPRVFDVQLQVNPVKEQVEAISISNALQPEDAGGAATITSKQLEP